MNPRSGLEKLMSSEQLMTRHPGAARWEPVIEGPDKFEQTERMMVPGGWIYRTLMWRGSNPSDFQVAMVFVPERSR